MTQPNYHSLTHKFILAGNCFVNIDEVLVVRPVVIETEEIKEYGIIMYFKNGTETHTVLPDKEAVTAAEMALYNLLLIVRNPSLPYDEQHAPVLPSIDWRKSNPLRSLPQEPIPVEEAIGG